MTQPSNAAGELAPQSLDYEDGERQLANELAHETSPESLFERRWALALLIQCFSNCSRNTTARGERQEFRSLAEHLSGTSTDESLAAVAERLQLSAEAVRVALHRLRRRYRHLLRHEIAQTTDSVEAVDDEIRHLFQVLSPRQ